jgi:hypothetical protein
MIDVVAIPFFPLSGKPPYIFNSLGCVVSDLFEMYFLPVIHCSECMS